MQYIVVVGSPLDGFKFYGPFENQMTAIAWSEEHVSIDEEHWVVLLNKFT